MNYEAYNFAKNHILSLLYEKCFKLKSTKTKFRVKCDVSVVPEISSCVKV